MTFIGEDFQVGAVLCFLFGFDILDLDPHVLLSGLQAFPGGLVEGLVVYAPTSVTMAEENLTSLAALGVLEDSLPVEEGIPTAAAACHRQHHGRRHQDCKVTFSFSVYLHLFGMVFTSHDYYQYTLSQESLQRKLQDFY